MIIMTSSSSGVTSKTANCKYVQKTHNPAQVTNRNDDPSPVLFEDDRITAQIATIACHSSIIPARISRCLHF